jgi:hypothetical protein
LRVASNFFTAYRHFRALKTVSEETLDILTTHEDGIERKLQHRGVSIQLRSPESGDSSLLKHFKSRLRGIAILHPPRSQNPSNPCPTSHGGTVQCRHLWGATGGGLWE